jgi:hypothetical protein
VLGAPRGVNLFSLIGGGPDEISLQEGLPSGVSAGPASRKLQTLHGLATEMRYQHSISETRRRHTPTPATPDWKTIWFGSPGSNDRITDMLMPRPEGGRHEQ